MSKHLTGYRVLAYTNRIVGIVVAGKGAQAGEHLREYSTCIDRFQAIVLGWNQYRGVTQLRNFRIVGNNGGIDVFFCF